MAVTDISINYTMLSNGTYSSSKCYKLQEGSSMRIAQPIELNEKEVKTLTSWSRGRRTPTRVMKRAKIVLMAAAGRQNKTIAELLGIDPRQVSRWRRRFAEKRLAGIEKDAARGGRKASKRNRTEDGMGSGLVSCYWTPVLIVPMVIVRALRIEFDGAIYYVTLRDNVREDIFDHDGDRN